MAVVDACLFLTKNLYPELIVSTFSVSENTLIEHDDHVEVNGVVFNKPFVEKPVSAEDHNICMYYPTSAGKK